MEDQKETVQQAELLEFFKALSSAERLKVVGLLAVESLTPAQIAERLHWPLRETLQHVGYLAHIGFISADAVDPLNQRGKGCYRLDTDWLQQTSRRLLANSQPRLSKEDFEGEDYDRKILKDYMTPAGQLRSIPTQARKRTVILHHLLQVFEPGQRYPEKQVNELLRRYHEDTAALRRYMVDAHLMARQDGVYWRVVE